jgi:hypothetical protein
MSKERKFSQTGKEFGEKGDGYNRLTPMIGVIAFHSQMVSIF